VAHSEAVVGRSHTLIPNTHFISYCVASVLSTKLKRTSEQNKISRRKSTLSKLIVIQFSSLMDHENVFFFPQKSATGR